MRKTPWGRARHPTPASLPGEPHGQRSLAGTVRAPTDRRVGHDCARAVSRQGQALFIYPASRSQALAADSRSRTFGSGNSPPPPRGAGSGHRRTRACVGGTFVPWGVGVRPAEGLLATSQLGRLCPGVIFSPQGRGGGVRGCTSHLVGKARDAADVLPCTGRGSRAKGYPARRPAALGRRWPQGPFALPAPAC